MSSQAELKKFRAELDRLDRELIGIVAKRFAVTRQIGKHKAENNLPIKDLGREKEMFAAREKLARRYSLDPKMVGKIFRAIVDHVYKNHRAMRK